MDAIQLYDDMPLRPKSGEVMSLATLPEAQKLSLIRETIVNMGVDENYIVMKLMDGAENAMFQGPKGEILPDHRTRLQYMNKLIKLLGLDKKEPLVITFKSLTSPELMY